MRRSSDSRRAMCRSARLCKLSAICPFSWRTQNAISHLLKMGSTPRGGGGWSFRPLTSHFLPALFVLIASCAHVQQHRLPPGGMRAKRSLLPKMGLSLLALYSKFHFSAEENSFLVPGWVGPKRGQLPPPPPGKQMTECDAIATVQRVQCELRPAGISLSPASPEL